MRPLGSLGLTHVLRYSLHASRCDKGISVNYTTVANASAPDKSFFVTCHPGAEVVLEKEILGIEGAVDVHAGKSGVHFKGSEATVYDVNLWVRSGIRVLELLSQVTLDPDEEAGDTLYEAFRGVVDWPEWLHSEDMSFSVDSRIWGNSNFTNSQLLNVRAKDAICDAIREKNGFKPSPPLRGMVSDVPIFATAFSDVLSIYLDYSGRSLHKRGFASKTVHKASLNECAAAACLQIAGFPELVESSGGELVTVVDPMCGSGTILSEAAMIAGNIAPGLYRRFWPFLRWPTSHKRLWHERVDRAKGLRSREKPNVLLLGNDIHSGALDLAAESIQRAGLQSIVRLHRGDIATYTLDTPPHMVITNPPWGQRLMGGDDDDDDKYGSPDGDLGESWRKLGQFLKEQSAGSEAYILSGNAQVTQHLKLRADRKYPLTIGGTTCRLMQYSIHKKRIPV